MKIDWIAFVILVLALSIVYLIKRYFSKNFSPTPSLAFSNLKNLSKSLTMREKFHYVPKRLYWISLIFLMSAFLDPHLISRKSPEKNASSSTPPKAIPTEGIAIYLLLDQSGSMAKNVLLNDKGIRKQIPRIDLLKEVTEKFIEARSNDLIGLIYFARIPRVVAPLTLDHKLLIQDLKELQVVDNPQNDGTSLGYAIFKASHLIAATRHYAEELNQIEPSPYQIKNSVIIAVSDGMQDPSNLDKGNRLRTIELEDAARFAKSQNVKLYVINIDSAFATEKYAPHRRQMQKITHLTGGEFYLASDDKDLNQIYATINDLEKSQIPQFTDQEKSASRTFSFYRYLIGAGMICFFFACLLESLYFKTVP